MPKERLRFKSDGGMIADPYVTFHFKVEIDGITKAHFQEVSGLNFSSAVDEVKEGGENFKVHKLMGQSKASNLTLKNGFTSNMDLIRWRDQIYSNRKGMRKQVIIHLLGDNQQPIATWVCKNAWPCKWESPQLTTKSSAIAIETLELAVEEIERKA